MSVESNVPPLSAQYLLRQREQLAKAISTPPPPPSPTISAKVAKPPPLSTIKSGVKSCFLSARIFAAFHVAAFGSGGVGGDRFAAARERRFDKCSRVDSGGRRSQRRRSSDSRGGGRSDKEEEKNVGWLAFSFENRRLFGLQAKIKS